MDAAFKLKTQNERTKVEDLFDYEGKKTSQKPQKLLKINISQVAK